ATPEIYPLSLHDALPIYPESLSRWKGEPRIWRYAVTRKPPAGDTLFPPDPPGRRRIGRARRGFAATARAMRKTGRLEDVDAAMLALARVTVDELDAAIA